MRFRLVVNRPRRVDSHLDLLTFSITNSRCTDSATISLTGSEDSDAVWISPDDVRDFNEDNILPLPAGELENIRNWLQPTHYDLERSEFSRHLASYLQGTGQWLLSTRTYKEWHQGVKNSVLWLKGIPGSGKSVMAVSIIQQLREEKVSVLYFFFPTDY